MTLARVPNGPHAEISGPLFKLPATPYPFTARQRHPQTLGRHAAQLRREEALAAGKQELAASSIDAQFNALEDVGELTEVEARLAALKVGGPQRAAIDAPSPDQV